MLGALLVAARDRGEDPVPPMEVVPLGLATFALAKLVAKEKVAAEIREPFVEETRHGRRPRGTGLRYAVGELITCTRCVGFLVRAGPDGAARAAARARPGSSRTVLGASAVNDVAQASFTWLCAKATAQDRATGEPVTGGVGHPAAGARRAHGAPGRERFGR
jgi:hypothetical protein